MTMAVATISLAGSDRLVQDPAALRSEPVPWRSPDLSPTNLAILPAARLGDRARADDAERVLRELGATVDRSDDTLYATAVDFAGKSTHPTRETRPRRSGSLALVDQRP